MSSRTLAVVGALLIVMLAPASAHAAAIEPLKPCYVTAETANGQQSEPVQITASGFAPNSKVNLTIDGQPVQGGTDLQTDAAGALSLPPNSVPAPFIRRGSRDFTVTLTQTDNPANTVSATAKTTALGVSVKPRKTAPSKQVRFKGAGFTAEKAIYAHWVYKGKVRKSLRLARKTKVCGKWTAHEQQIPIDDPGTGSWIVQFDQSKKYFKPGNPQLQSVFVRIEIRVTLTPKRL